MGYVNSLEGTLLKTNIFAPENGWLDFDPFSLGFPLLSCAMLVSGRVRNGSRMVTLDFFRAVLFGGGAFFELSCWLNFAAFQLFTDKSIKPPGKRISSSF